jgi:hypothetical protein
MVATRIWIGILPSVVVADFTVAQEIKDAQKAIVAEAADHASTPHKRFAQSSTGLCRWAHQRVRSMAHFVLSPRSL